MTGPRFHVVLYHPEIPPNTGNVGRLCLGLGLRLHLVHPLGFSTDAKAVRRAGLDYWQHVDLVEHADEDAFWRWAEGRRVHLFSSKGARSHVACPYAPDDVLVFGRETVGLPDDLVARHGAWRIPMTGPIRSLNLSNAVAVVAYRALERIDPDLFA
ncbi:MAG: tRNA (uridine(34)/cytosine(34)/5-carboxymethylaminomethyluridine(34)-2'-O)-methyltransferase TrmL [Alphaproteobacteria bacterium]|nr:tRNA (uridine(34)/cytosine(34)/5-carboxymethylaminomethyluridine(34)-2'-O)-methyltransferase TrmL [Alphaproteobacteria bacterium]